MDIKLKKPIAITGALIVLFIIILLISNGNVTLNVFSLVILLALIALCGLDIYRQIMLP